RSAIACISCRLVRAVRKRGAGQDEPERRLAVIGGIATTRAFGGLEASDRHRRWLDRESVAWYPRHSRREGPAASWPSRPRAALVPLLLVPTRVSSSLASGSADTALTICSSSTASSSSTARIEEHAGSGHETVPAPAPGAGVVAPGAPQRARRAWPRTPHPVARV